MSQQTHQTTIGEPRIVALSRITPGEDFNPRLARDPERFAQLVASVRADGVLQPLLVTPEPEGDGLRLIAGEGRWLAAAEAGHSQVPVYVVEVDDRTGGLELALAENLARQDLDPVQEAHGYERLRAAGLTKKGIAERLGIAQKRRDRAARDPEAAGAAASADRVRPDSCGGDQAAGRARAHPSRASRVRGGAGRRARRARVGAAAQLDRCGQRPRRRAARRDRAGWDRLPDGVYDLSEPVPVARFSVGEHARAELAELCELIGVPAEGFEVRFGREALERAAALKAVHPAKSGWAHLLVGQDVADELAADHIHACLENQRKAAEHAQAGPSSQDVDGGEPGAPEPSSEEKAREARRAERAEAERERQHAVAFNAQLGAALFKHIARVKVDADVLKILTVVDVAGDIDGVAARGARYAFPGWTTEVAQRNGKVKVEYLDTPAAGAKAREFVAGGESLAEIAGRLFCLIAAARYADERAVARSNRSMSWLNVRGGLPYSDEVVDLIDEICAQRLPEHLTADVREQRADQREVLAEHARGVAATRDRIDVALQRASELSDEERQQVEADIELVHGRYSIEGHRLRKRLQEPESSDSDAGQGKTGDGDEVATAA